MLSSTALFMGADATELGNTPDKGDQGRREGLAVYLSLDSGPRFLLLLRGGRGCRSLAWEPPSRCLALATPSSWGDAHVHVHMHIEYTSV